MAKPTPSNPLEYILKRQYTDKYNLHKTLLKERLNAAQNLYRKDLLAHYGCVNAIEFSNKGDLMASGGDDRRVLIWDVEHAIQGKGRPNIMKTQHHSNVFCLGFDSINKRVFSAGNDDQVICHDIETGKSCEFFQHDQPVYGLCIDPLNDHVFASACDDGKILIYDIREPSSSAPFCLASYLTAFHAVMYNPMEPRLLTTANSKEGVGLWDVRKPCQILVHYGGDNPSQSCMSVRFNERGTHILALRRRLPPVLYATHSSPYVCQFDHPGYYNSCTMKSCCFAGQDDEYILSGSDDFNLYVWKVPESPKKGQWVGTAHMVLRGHRSIVNQVRFNTSNYIIASSGVEKLIKFWSPFALPDSEGSLTNEIIPKVKERKVFTHDEYISLVLRSGQFMSHDYSHQSTKEDPRMMAFFDSLVQREIEGWTSDDSASSDISTSMSAFRGALREAATNSSDSESAHSDSPSSAVVPSQTSESSNRISQLIARKRNQLMKLARARSQPHRSRSILEKRFIFNKPLTSSSDTDSSDSEQDLTSNSNSGNTSSLPSTSCLGSTVSMLTQHFLHQPRRKPVFNFSSRAFPSSRMLSPVTNTVTTANDRNSRRLSFRFVCDNSSDDDSDEHFIPINTMRVKFEKQQQKEESNSSCSMESSRCTILTAPQGIDTSTSDGKTPSNKKPARGRKRVLCYFSSDSDAQSNDDSASTSSHHGKVVEEKLNGVKTEAVENGNTTERGLRKHCHKKRIILSSDSSDDDSNLNNYMLPKKENEVPLDLNNKVLTTDGSQDKSQENAATQNGCKAVEIDDARLSRYFNGYGTSDEEQTASSTVDIPTATTPNAKLQNGLIKNSETPDSGIGIPSCSSEVDSNPASWANGNSMRDRNATDSLFSDGSSTQAEESSDSFTFKRRHINRIRRNYRNHIGDSDSN